MPRPVPRPAPRPVLRPGLRICAAALVGLALAVSTTPGFANSKKGRDTAAAIAAAAALALGVAALAHDESDYSPGKPMLSGQQKAEFEAGYRDGLAGARYRTSQPAATYGEGYNAGVRERQSQQAGKGGPRFKDVPNKAMKGCIERAAKDWGVKRGRVWATDARKGAAGTWLIEVVAGKRQGVCTMAADGTKSGKFLNGASL